MKKRVLKFALAFSMSFSLVGMNVAASSAKTLETTGLETEYDMLELERTKPGDNLITNGGFENNGANWKTTGNGQITNYEGCAAAGEYCGLLPSNSSNAAVYQVLTLKANTDYKVTAKMQFGAEGSEAFVAIKTANVENLNPAIETTVRCEAGEAWQYKDVTFEFNSGDNTNVSLAFLKWTEDETSAIYKSQVYIDEVKLSEVGAGDSETDDEVYEVVWKDEFDGTTGDVDGNGLDLDNWGYELGSVRGVEQQHYTNDKENVHVTDGKLVLEVTDREKQYQYKNPRGERQVIYNSGSVRTHGKKEFLYGRIEILAKLPEGQATFPAFWTLGSDFTLDGLVNSQQGKGWPVSGEIDIMESIGNPNVVYQTLHYSQEVDKDNGKYAGNGKTTNITTEGVEIDGETYHVFGLNWSENKMEWYVDDQIVRTVDYSDDPVAQVALNRPQYIQLNFATGGNWPGDAGTNLAGQTFEIEYVYYAQNQEQKAAAQAYYENTVAVDADDVTIYEGTVPDLLENVTLVPGSDSVDTSKYTVDYSIENEQMFTSTPDLTDESTSNDTNQTKVELLVNSAANKDKIANLAPGEYNIHYSAMSDDQPSVRKTVKLTVLEEPEFPSDFELNGIIGGKLGDIVLPEGWSWVNPDATITGETGEYEVQYVDGTYSKTVTVTVKAKVADKTDLEDAINAADLEVVKDDTYTLASRNALKAAIDSARAVFANVNATDEEIANAIQVLNDAVANLEKYVDEKDVNDLVEKGNSLVGKTDIYTKDSLDKLSAALADVESALEAGNKEAIQSAYARLNDAIAGLVKNDTTTDPSVTPSNPNSGSNSSTAVKTGDETAIGTALFVLTMSAAGVVLFKKRKRC